MSSTTVDFGERVVSRDRIKKVPSSKEITLTNDDGESLSWKLSVDNVDMAYLSVQCTGSGIYPHLSFDKGDVILQGIPAGELRKSIRRDAEALAILYILGSGT
jgi:hypothetical protein